MNAPRPACGRYLALRWRLLGVCSLALYLSGACSAIAQQTAQPADQSAKSQSAREVVTKEAIPTFSSRVNLVPVTVVVRDSQGRPVGNLTKEDFRVLDNGKPRSSPASRSNARTHPSSWRRSQLTPTPRQPRRAATRAGLALRRLSLRRHSSDIRRSGVCPRRGGSSCRYVPAASRPGCDLHDLGPGHARVHRRSGQAQEAISLLRPNPLTGAATAKCPDISLFMADLIINRTTRKPSWSLSRNTLDAAATRMSPRKR